MRNKGRIRLLLRVSVQDHVTGEINGKVSCKIRCWVRVRGLGLRFILYFVSSAYWYGLLVS